MLVLIPSAAGVPGISGPPNWFSGEPTFNPNLDDVRWRGAVKRTFGSGTGGSNFFRATQATVAAQKFIYLTFRAAFAPDLNDQDDLVYFGLRKHTTGDGMVVRVKVHGPAFTPAGPPSANPPASVAEVTIWTSSGGSWTFNPVPPAWINANARMWLQSDVDVPTDMNNRWGVQLRIPANALGDITDGTGPNLGTHFDMWYLIKANSGIGPVILADSRTAGTTSDTDLQDLNFPPFSRWDEYQLTSAAATSGGVALYWSDVAVTNAHGEGSLIDNHNDNTFLVRPRNYSTLNIPAGQINATIRIANWGSVGDPANSPDFSTGVWEYVPGNDENTPLISGSDVGPIPAGNPPPPAAPISHLTPMNLSVPPKSLHQCILVTLSGANITFLNDAVTRNMNFDSASLLQREADISLVGLKPFSPAPRDVYLAVEKLNMGANAKADEGQFLLASMERLMRRDERLGGKLKQARGILLQSFGETQSDRLQTMVKVLADVGLTEEELDQLFPTCRIHVYHDTGERVNHPDGTERPVLKEQTSFGLYVYHEGELEGWQTSIQGAQRVADNLYLLAVPNDSSAKITVTVQAVGRNEERIPEDPIKPIEFPKASGTEPHDRKGCWFALWKLFGFK